MLTAEDVLNQKFSSTKFVEGYDQDEVDDFLDEVVATLRAGEAGIAMVAPVTPDTVLKKRFQATKFREGYDMQQVDDLLERVRVTLQERPPTLAPAPAAAPPPPPPSSVVAPPLTDASTHTPGLVPPRPSWWRRLFGA
ncbi:DivIVA domain-containing protein [Cellulomonas sp. S1-8]|uniref:DivIVA domain-containing protein n=1 Tax=Cellulomonas sp. S1-8 TaxID=2904790 RepID=UPI002243C42D|nr:DivIVA domain-containing protein [Cellulomonas sp. S1-8]UZN04188.1 DivIVA domain-containing protein [Cellulomonas sp. S1-8]